MNGRAFQFESDDAKGLQMNASTVLRLNWRPLLSAIYAGSRSPIWSMAKTEERWFSIGIASNGALVSVVYLWSEADSGGDEDPAGIGP